MPYCEDCGTKLDGGICPNCQEELYIFGTQMTEDHYDQPISDEFAEKVRQQREQVRKVGRK